jgi:phosphoglycerate dehydrogenase-like enzyme
MIIYVDLERSSADAKAYETAIFKARIANVEIRYKNANASADLRDVDILVGQRFRDDAIAASTKLKWIAFWGAGIETAVTDAVREKIARGLLVTNASGVHGPNIAEHVLAIMLSFTRRLGFYNRAQQQKIWKHDESTSQIEELAGQTLGIVGLGRIGEALATRAKAFEMRVLATKRDISTRHASSSAVDHLMPMGDLHVLLGESDHVCVALPLTKETRHVIDGAQLAQMKKTARIYNIARGAVIDEAALVNALREKTIAGAGLDVFEEEPLPASSPLWSMENVMLTPHVAGITPHYYERAAALFAENLARFARGETLENLFDDARGY